MLRVRKLITGAAIAAVAAGAIGMGTATAALADSEGPQQCAVQSRNVSVTGDGYALTNIRADYRTDAPKKNAFASYSLSGAPQACEGGEFFVFDILTRRIVPMQDGSMSVQDWQDVRFAVPSGMRLFQVMHGDSDDPWNATFVGSVTKL
ncbi:hypothetical protein [Streptomyces sp. NBC_01264]|uniref:hypothetical protein n=1 Tax=Streptomyces sp. NBC_01264 TaxID=2903804 RepID=UPI00225076D5|nr:hypothetical protein [Streptomyces sp. NBC_01264]MCX4784321.1 hypothetical protein [Streptomyces sp. NBC_01264]